jgi:hypothetical protein
MRQKMVDSLNLAIRISSGKQGAGAVDQIIEILLRAF